MGRSGASPKERTLFLNVSFIVVSQNKKKNEIPCVLKPYQGQYQEILVASLAYPSQRKA